MASQSRCRFQSGQPSACRGSVIPRRHRFPFPAGRREISEGFLAWRQVAFPKTHDLQELLDLVESVDGDLAASLRDVIVLTPHGVEARYPADLPDATREEAREAVELARKLRGSVRNRLEGIR